MTEEQVADPVASPVAPAAKPKMKASWVRTILWMLSMIMLVNLAMVIVFWFWNTYLRK
jgi:hypothetical protein